jgi:hypothetical protein
MSQKVRLVVPEAPAIQAAAAGRQRELKRESMRIGILDNSKANADHLLRFIVEGVKAALPVKSVIVLRKANSSIGAHAAVIDQLTAEADFVVSAMAD